MRSIPAEFYGDVTRWFVATVIDGSPPSGLEGRVRIRINGVHSDDVNDIPQKDLPWAQVLVPSTSFGVSGFGNASQILPGALVFGMFLDGDNSQLPLVLGSLPRVEYPSTVQAEGREDLSTNPFSYDFNQTNAEVIDPILNQSPSNASNAVRFFIDNGFRAKEASSIVGVLETISGLDPTQESNGVGIAGWQPDSSRWKKYYAYTSRLLPAKDPTSFDAQLIYVLTELRTNQVYANAKLKQAKEIKGTLYGQRIDGVETRGNGMVAALVKYYVPSGTSCSKETAEGNAEQFYGGLGAR